MIPKGSLLASDPEVPVQDARHGLLVASWLVAQRSCMRLPVGFIGKRETTQSVLEVETWFESTCRDCAHKSTKGSTFRMVSDAQVLMVSGTYFDAADLLPGQRLRAMGCQCGYQEVREVRTIDVEPEPLYKICLSINENYGVSDGNHVVFLHGYRG